MSYNSLRSAGQTYEDCDAIQAKTIQKEIQVKLSRVKPYVNQLNPTLSSFLLIFDVFGNHIAVLRTNFGRR